MFLWQGSENLRSRTGAAMSAAFGRCPGPASWGVRDRGNGTVLATSYGTTRSREAVMAIIDSASARL